MSEKACVNDISVQDALEALLHTASNGAIRHRVSDNLTLWELIGMMYDRVQEHIETSSTAEMIGFSIIFERGELTRDNNAVLYLAVCNDGKMSVRKSLVGTAGKIASLRPDVLVQTVLGRNHTLKPEDYDRIQEFSQSNERAALEVAVEIRPDSDTQE